MLVVAATLGLAHAKSDYPTRPITIVVPYAEGGPTDKVARPIAAEMSKQLGQPVLLKFQGGEGATRAPRELVRDGGDSGYTLLLHNIGMASAPTLYRQLRFDPQKDYEPIGLIADAPMLILGKRDLPPRDAKQLWP